MIRRLMSIQQRLSASLDRLLPKKYSVDGNQDFVKAFIPKYFKENLKIYDVGGGKNPYLDPEKKRILNATVSGLDIDERQLDSAPIGAYDRIIASDITKFQGNSDADLVICQALLEHVRDTEKAFAAISSILKPGGVALIFVPSRNAIYSRINILLPQSVKKWVLHTLYPATKGKQGFHAYYDKCTPRDFRRLSERNGLSVVEERHYFISSYFSCLFPIYLMWRAWILTFHFLSKEQAAETFAMCLRKKTENGIEQFVKWKSEFMNVDYPIPHHCKRWH
jgi:SAM-dependent methyltransferase